MKTISPKELHERLRRGERIQLLDVREPEEYELVHLNGALLIPLALLPIRHGELKREDEIVVYCHHGVRSAMAVRFLSAQGYSAISNLEGGIDRWSVEADPAVPRY